MLKHCGLIFLFAFSVAGSLLAQREEERKEGPIITKKDSSAFAEVKGRNFKITPYLAPTVSPEYGAMLSGGGLVSFSLDRENKFIQPSSIPFSFGYSTNGTMLFNLRPALFFKNDKNRLMGDLWYKDMPDNYWGIGYEDGRNPSQPDSTTKYQRAWTQIFIKYSHQFRENLFIGALFDYNRTVATNPGSRMQEDPNFIIFGPDVGNLSLGLLFQYDSRDLTVNAYEGVFLEMSSNFYQSEVRSRPTFQVLSLDYRQYKQIKRPGRTMAWQARGRFATGEVPWPMMSQLGTPFDLRGYRWGRFRDKYMIFGIVEYRHMFMRKSPRKDGNMMSRFGVVPWLATGSIAPDISNLTNWLPNGGIGLRYEVQKRMNARFDYGIGRDTRAFYISFNETF